MNPQSSDRDRRLDPRLSDEGVVHVEYIAPSPHVRDLSASGVYLADPRDLHMGQTVKLRLQLSPTDTPFTVTGMVRRVDPGQGFAIEFIQLESADRRRIKEYISRSNPDAVSPAGRDGLG